MRWLPTWGNRSLPISSRSCREEASRSGLGPFAAGRTGTVLQMQTALMTTECKTTVPARSEHTGVFGGSRHRSRTKHLLYWNRQRLGRARRQAAGHVRSVLPSPRPETWQRLKPLDMLSPEAESRNPEQEPYTEHPSPHPTALTSYTTGALIITYSILGVPYYNHSILGLIQDHPSVLSSPPRPTQTLAEPAPEATEGIP